MWRDLVSFTFNIYTAVGREQLSHLIAHAVVPNKPSEFQIESANLGEGGTVEGWFRFQCALGSGRGIVRLAGGKILTLLTTLTELKGHKEASGVNRPKGVEHEYKKKETTAKKDADDQPYALIVGGGQAGLGLAARLKALGVSAVVVDRHAAPGDAWRSRYAELVLHDPVWFDHLPLLPFPETWPVFASKDKMADWLNHYTSIMELTYWGSTDCKRATYDAAKAEWTAHLVRDGKEVVVRPQILVFAVGIFGSPKIPHVPGIETFRGAWHHSSKHPGGAAYAGKHCVVVGSNNSAHDVCAGLWSAGAASVTMIQRSASMVIRSDPLLKSFAPLYSQEAYDKGMTTDKADLYLASVPYPMLAFAHKPFYDGLQQQDADFYNSLRKVGFETHFGIDGTGLFMSYLRTGGGYYIDVGASKLVIDGEIKLKRGDISRVTEKSLVFSDGSEINADLIVFATGYNTLESQLESILGKDVASSIGKVWGLGSGAPNDPGPAQSELRNIWKPTPQPGLFIHGGNLMMSRFYSQFVALQIKARKENVNVTKVYEGIEKK